MKKAEVEFAVERAISAAAAGRNTEDSYVELKSEWPDPDKAARRLAGHANAARSEPIIWVIGVAEDGRVANAAKEELSNWWAQVQKRFDGQPPELRQVVNLTIGSNEIVALQFDTDSAPYVVKALQQQGAIQREVPWREGNATRSATRRDLIQILVPAARAPDVEVLLTEMKRTRRPRDPRERGVFAVDNSITPSQLIEDYCVTFSLYITPRTKDVIVLPLHKVEGELVCGSTTFPLRAPSLRPGSRSATVRVTASEAIIEGPGRLIVSAHGITQENHFGADLPFTAVVRLVPAGESISLVCRADLARDRSVEGDPEWRRADSSAGE